MSPLNTLGDICHNDSIHYKFQRYKKMKRTFYKPLDLSLLVTFSFIILAKCCFLQIYFHFLKILFLKQCVVKVIVAKLLSSWWTLPAVPSFLPDEMTRTLKAKTKALKAILWHTKGRQRSVLEKTITLQNFELQSDNYLASQLIRAESETISSQSLIESNSIVVSSLYSI